MNSFFQLFCRHKWEDHSSYDSLTLQLRWCRKCERKEGREFVANYWGWSDWKRLKWLE